VRDLLRSFGGETSNPIQKQLTVVVNIKNNRYAKKIIKHPFVHSFSIQLHSSYSTRLYTYYLLPIVCTEFTVEEVLLFDAADPKLPTALELGLIAEASISRRRRSVLISLSDAELPPPLAELERLSFISENLSLAGLAVALVPVRADNTSEMSVAEEDRTLG